MIHRKWPWFEWRFDYCSSRGGHLTVTDMLNHLKPESPCGAGSLSMGRLSWSDGPNSSENVPLLSCSLTRMSDGIWLLQHLKLTVLNIRRSLPLSEVFDNRSVIVCCIVQISGVHLWIIDWASVQPHFNTGNKTQKSKEQPIISHEKQVQGCNLD